MKWQKRTLRALALSVTLPAILGACAATTDSGETSAPASVACAAFRPITWSARDTDQTIAEVKSHNAAYVAICEGGA